MIGHLAVKHPSYAELYKDSRCNYTDNVEPHGFMDEDDGDL